MRKRVLLVIHTVTFFNELLRVAKSLRSSSTYEPCFLFPHFYTGMEKHVDTCLAEEFICIGTKGELLQKNTTASLRTFFPESSFKQGLKKLLQRLHLLQVLSWVLKFKDVNNRSYNIFLFEIVYLRRRVRVIASWLAQYRVSLVVLGGDVVHYDTACFVRAAHNNKISAVLVPCTMSNALEMAESYYPMRDYWLTHGYNRWFGKFFPQWVYEHKGRKLLRLPAPRALALEILRLAPPKPWINLSGFADAIATESEAMVTYYTREGIPRDQLTLIGTIADDVLADILVRVHDRRLALYEKLHLNLEKPLVVSALPPDQLYMVGGRPECEFRSYHDLVTFWIESLAQITNYNVVVNLHPALSYEKLKQYERGGVTIVSENVTALIPLCDIFVASVSTIIRWAIACCKPVINYDVYRFRYNDYLNLPGVRIMEQSSAFRQELHRVTTDSKYRKTLVEGQQRHAKYWGNLDGGAGKRMLKLFDSLTSKRKGERKEITA